MNLTKLVTDKIKKLGPKEAAKYFGVSIPTIYSWKKSKNAPVSAVQKVLDEAQGSTEITYDGLEKVAKYMKDTLESEMPLPDEGGNKIRDIPTPEMEVAPEVIEEQAMPDERMIKSDSFVITEILARLDRIERAIVSGQKSEIQQYLMTKTDPDANVPVTSGIHPFKNPESGIQVKSAAELIGDPESRAPKKKDWNVPVGEPQGEQGGKGWNEPINPTQGRNPGSDWNKPLNT